MELEIEHISELVRCALSPKGTFRSTSPSRLRVLRELVNAEYLRRPYGKQGNMKAGEPLTLTIKGWNFVKDLNAEKYERMHSFPYATDILNAQEALENPEEYSAQVSPHEIYSEERLAAAVAILDAYFSNMDA